MKSFEQRIRRIIQEDVAIVHYDPQWPELFRWEKEHLLACLPVDLIRRIEHFGSTAVPGLSAKPIVDILVEVTDLQVTREKIAPVLELQGYDYFWRPTHGDDGPPWYAWFIKRDPATGERTHHIHMVEADFSDHWNRLLFRDFLIEHPHVAAEYGQLKQRLAADYPRDWVAYSQGKGAFIVRVTEQAQALVQPILQTERLVLRPVRPSDAPAIQRTASAREIADTMISIPHPYPAGEAVRYVARQVFERDKGLALTFIIESKMESRFCGLIEIRAIEREHSQAEMSFWIAVEAQGQGYMSEAVRAVLQYGFEDLVLNRFYAYHMVRNPSSGRVLEKNGFTQEGYLRQRVIKWGEYEDVLLWAILQQDWLEAKHHH